MKKQESLSLISLAVTGVLCGGTQALAVPMLDSDLASSTVLGARMASKPSSSAIGGNVGDWANGGAHAISVPISSAGLAGLGTHMSGGTGHTGILVARQAQAPLPFGTGDSDSPRQGPPRINPDLDRLIFPPRIDGVAAGPDTRSKTPIPDGKRIANTETCDKAGINSGGATLDQDNPAANCKDSPEGNGDSNGTTAPVGTKDVASLPDAPDSKGGNEGLSDVPEFVATPGSGSPSDASFLPLALVSDDSGRSVPEPATLALLGIGLAGLGVSRRRPR